MAYFAGLELLTGCSFTFGRLTAMGYPKTESSTESYTVCLDGQPYVVWYLLSELSLCALSVTLVSDLSSDLP